MSDDDVRYALEGLWGQSKTVKALYEATGVDTAGIDSIMTSVTVLLALIDASQEPAQPADGCQHPVDKQKVTRAGGGHSITMCEACNEIIDQT